MNVLIISNDPSLFVEGSPARDRMRAYAAAIGSLTVLSRAGAEACKLYKDGVQEGGLTLYAVRGGKVFGIAALKNKAHALIKERGIEVVSAQDPFEHGWAAAQAVRGTGAKLHLQVHTDFCSPWFTKGKGDRAAEVKMPLINKVRVRLADTLLPKAHGIRAASLRVKTSLVTRYGARIVEPSVIPIAVPITEVPAIELPPHPFTFTLMTIGRLEPEKRIEDILFALARIHRLYPMIGLMIVGDGRSRPLLEMHVAKLGLQDVVQFLGWRTDAAGLLRSANAYIQVSAYEGYGMTLIEAAIARVPIITTDVGIVGEVFTGYEDVLSAPVGDPAALAVHISGLIEDQQARRSLVINAEQKARAHLALIPDQPARIAADLHATLGREPQTP